MIVAATLVAVGTTTSVADRAAAADDPAVVEFAAAAPPGGALAPVVEESMAASPRSRFVHVDTAVLLADLAGDGVTFELFEDVAVVFDDRGELTVGVDGNATWSGTTATATATLSFADDGVRGSIQTSDTSYSIVPVDGATHLLFEEGRSFPPTEEPLVPPAEPVWASDAPTQADTAESDSTATSVAGQFTSPVAADDGAPVVRVLTVFDDLASAYFGGDANAVAELSDHDRRGQRGLRAVRCQPGDAVRRHRPRWVRVQPGGNDRTEPDHAPGRWGPRRPASAT